MFAHPVDSLPTQQSFKTAAWDKFQDQMFILCSFSVISLYWFEVVSTIISILLKHLKIYFDFLCNIEYWQFYTEVVKCWPTVTRGCRGVSKSLTFVDIWASNGSKYAEGIFEWSLTRQIYSDIHWLTLSCLQYLLIFIWFRKRFSLVKSHVQRVLSHKIYIHFY